MINESVFKNKTIKFTCQDKLFFRALRMLMHERQDIYSLFHCFPRMQIDKKNRPSLDLLSKKAGNLVHRRAV
jgi:hypothetical protein